MRLTDKCKEDFLNYYWNSKIKPLSICTKEDLESFFDSIYEIYQNALIIEFFDSVGIYISIECYYDALLGYNRGFEAIIFDEQQNTKYDCNPSDCFETRTEAVNEAIIKANALWNENNSYLAH